MKKNDLGTSSPKVLEEIQEESKGSFSKKPNLKKVTDFKDLNKISK